MIVKELLKFISTPRGGKGRSLSQSRCTLSSDFLKKVKKNFKNLKEPASTQARTARRESKERL